jgi:Cytochrome b562
MLTRSMRTGLASLIAIGSLAIAGASLAQPEKQPETSPARGKQPGGRGQGGGPATVEQAMRGINRAARELKAQIGDASKMDENLALIWAMERGAVAAKGLEPEHLPAGDKAKIVNDFRRGQIELLKLMLTLETQVMDGKTEDATKTFGAIVELRDKSHKKLGVKE